MKPRSDPGLFFALMLDFELMFMASVIGTILWMLV
jgi:hypothetical protein